MDETGGRHPLGVLDEAIEGCGRRHQGGALFRPDFGDGAVLLLRMAQFRPEGDATRRQPVVQVGQRIEGRGAVPNPVPGILDVLLDLAFLPARGGVAELGIEHVVVDHDLEAQVDLPLPSLANPVDRGLHVVVDAAPGNPAQHRKGMVVGIEQHFVGLQRIGAQQKGPAVRQLELGNLQLGAFAADHGPVLAPVELEGFAGGERQRNKGAAAGGPGGLMLHLPPVPGKGGDPVVGTRVAKRHQVGVDLPQVAALLAPLAGLGLEPGRQLVDQAIKLARALPIGVVGVGDPVAQVFANGVAGQTRASGDLPDCHYISQAPPPDYTQ